MQANKRSNEPKKQAGRWAPDQHERFMAAIVTYGKDWKKVQEIVKTRTSSQVRSHAQKFFNRLLKQQNLKQNGQLKFKVPKIRQNEHDQSQNQNSFLKDIHQDCSNITPIELVTLIKGQALKNDTQKINIKSFQKKLQQRLADIQQDNNEDQNIDALQLKRQSSYKSMNNILDVYQNLKGPESNPELESQSFLMKLTKKYKKYFGTGGKFENLIDFGNPVQVERAQRSIRKRSFTLPEGVDGNQQDLNSRKKRLITEQSTAKLTSSQKESFTVTMNLVQQTEQIQKPKVESLPQNCAIEKKQ